MDRKQKPILTISLLTSNRPETVRNCLESLTPLRQAIPCELIITDTSKSPVIREIIEEYADRIYEFEWCNDFSKARNLGLSKARGEWFLYVDDDEWFDDLSEMIEFFRSGEYKEYGYANYKTRDYIDPGLNYYSDTWASRMIRIDPDTHFKSKIHEHFEPVRGKLKSLNCYTHHVGYIYKTHEDLMKHFNRNEPLLREMMEEEPDNLRWQIQLVQEYRNIKDWDKICDFCEVQLKKNASVNNKYDNIHLGTLYAGYAEALLFQKKYTECIRICKKGLTDLRCTDATKAYLHLKLIEAYFWLDEIENTKEYLDIYFKEAKELPARESKWVEENVALLVNEVFDETNIKKAYSILIGCDLKQGNTKQLQKYYEKLEWKRDVIYVYDNIETVFVDAMAKLPYEPIFSEVITDAFKNAEFRRIVTEQIQDWELKDTIRFCRIVPILAKADSDDWYIWYARILDADERKDTEALVNALEKFYQFVPNVFMISEEVYNTVAKYGLEAAEFWKEVEPEKWKRSIQDYFKVAGKEHILRTTMRVRVLFAEGGWRREFFELSLIEHEVAMGPIEFWNMESYVNAIRNYVNMTLEYYSKYYVDEALTLFPEVLPKNVQASIKLMEYLEVEATNTVHALHSLKEATDIYPSFGKGIGLFLKQYSELEKQRAQKRKEELQELRDQIMNQTREFMEKRQIQEASAIIEQLKQMMPEDLDVIALGLEVRLKAL